MVIKTSLRQFYDAIFHKMLSCHLPVNFTEQDKLLLERQLLLKLSCIYKWDLWQHWIIY